jgi:hypothetical protein
MKVTNMSESRPVRVNLVWDEATFLTGAKILYDYTLRHSWRRYLGWIFIALAQFGVVLALKQGTSGMLFLGTLLMIYWYFLRWPSRKAALKRQFAQAELAGKKLRIVADDSELKVDGAPLPWSAVHLALSTPEGYLLAIENGFLYLPRNVFADERQRRSFGNLLAAHARRFEKWPEKPAAWTGKGGSGTIG